MGLLRLVQFQAFLDAALLLVPTMGPHPRHDAHADVTGTTLLGAQALGFALLVWATMIRMHVSLIDGLLDSDDDSVLHGHFRIPLVGLGIVRTADGFRAFDLGRTQTRSEDGNLLPFGDSFLQSFLRCKVSMGVHLTSFAVSAIVLSIRFRYRWVAVPLSAELLDGTACAISKDHAITAGTEISTCILQGRANADILVGMTPLILDYIRQHITYDPNTGALTKKGKLIGTRRKDSYLTYTVILDTKYQGCTLSYWCYAHQIAWYLAMGEWAEQFIDHVNGDPGDNRLVNLRLATPAQNSHNQRKRPGLSSQYKGVTKAGKKWKAYIDVDGKKLSLGRYLTEVDAAKAYDAKAREVRGEYAKCNFPLDGLVGFAQGS